MLHGRNISLWKERIVLRKEAKNDSVAEERDGLEHYVGKLKYPLTNDFLFKAVLQKNQTALKGLLCALLHMKMEEIVSIRIVNPIEIGGIIDNKIMMLDLKLELNDSRILDIEMQVIDRRKLAGEVSDISLQGV